MKKTVFILFKVWTLCVLAACGGSQPGAKVTADGVDVDLTQMNATIMYAELSNTIYVLDDYVGKIIRMNGTVVSSVDPETNITYHAVIIRDATACCASGLDYVLADGQAYPADETDVTVTGEFLYKEDGFFFCQLRGAVLGA